MEPTKVLILGAAGRDFHNFNTYFRDNENYEVVAFTATQIPDIEGRTYPKELAGKLSFYHFASWHPSPTNKSSNQKCELSYPGLQRLHQYNL